jgi:hypothetical protein
MTIQKQFKCKKHVGRTPGADAGFAAVARPPYLACVELSKVISYFRFKENSKVNKGGLDVLQTSFGMIHFFPIQRKYLFKTILLP